jgi:hypothetical protein
MMRTMTLLMSVMNKPDVGLVVLLSGTVLTVLVLWMLSRWEQRKRIEFLTRKGSRISTKDLARTDKCAALAIRSGYEIWRVNSESFDVDVDARVVAGAQCVFSESGHLANVREVEKMGITVAKIVFMPGRNIKRVPVELQKFRRRN